MQCNIVYLKPKTTYRPAMKSDTLWAALCWGICTLHGEDFLIEFINSYGEGASKVEPIYLSSAFPYYKRHAANPILFLPRPLKAEKDCREVPKGAEFKKAIDLMRECKLSDKESFISKASFEYLFCESNQPAGNELYRELGMTVKPMTHNTIDRLTGSTLTIGNKGQLFHTEERMMETKNKKDKAGLYFLFKGNTELLKQVLRFWEHFGIGGDRTIGKGQFEFELQENIEIKEPAQPNARMALSLYHPTPDEVKAYDEDTSKLLQYKTIVRQGWKGAFQKKPALYFEEGSVIPYKHGSEIMGNNINGGQHQYGHTITQYGYGFMLNLKMPENEG